MKDGLTTIALHKSTKERLSKYGETSQSFDILLNRFMDRMPVYVYKSDMDMATREIVKFNKRLESQIRKEAKP